MEANQVLIWCERSKVEGANLRTISLDVEPKHSSSYWEASWEGWVSVLAPHRMVMALEAAAVLLVVVVLVAGHISTGLIGEGARGSRIPSTEISSSEHPNRNLQSFKFKTSDEERRKPGEV